MMIALACILFVTALVGILVSLVHVDKYAEYPITLSGFLLILSITYLVSRDSADPILTWVYGLGWFLCYFGPIIILAHYIRPKLLEIEHKSYKKQEPKEIGLYKYDAHIKNFDANHHAAFTKTMEEKYLKDVENMLKFLVAWPIIMMMIPFSAIVDWVKRFRSEDTKQFGR